jgi:UDP:flavonoid glycosyltransferase YjiC (YdhE family)
MPEIVLCPRELDFPHSDVADRYYVEPAIDLERSGGEFPWHLLDSTKTLIYCAMGSQSHRSGEAGRIVRAAIEAVRGREDWQLVVVTGAGGGDSPADEPSNVIQTEHAPQLEILRRAALMITHGGLGSVKECLYFGVPMIVFPLMRDQPGNGARVVHHGLGALGTPVAETLRTELERVLADGALRARMRIFSQRFQALERERLSLNILESFLQPEAARNRARRAESNQVQIGEREISPAFARS